MVEPTVRKASWAWTHLFVQGLPGKPRCPLALDGGQWLEYEFLGCARETPESRGEARLSPPRSRKPSELCSPPPPAPPRVRPRRWQEQSSPDPQPC